MTEQRFRDAVHDLTALPFRRFPVAPLMVRAFELRDNVTAYDACYVALAEALDATLVTADARLAAAPGINCRVQVLGDEYGSSGSSGCSSHDLPTPHQTRKDRRSVRCDRVRSASRSSNDDSTHPACAWPVGSRSSPGRSSPPHTRHRSPLVSTLVSVVRSHR